MSSNIEAVGLIAAPIIIPVAAVAFGAGWAAWKAGKLIYDGVSSVYEQENKRQRIEEEKARNRYMIASNNYQQMIDNCKKLYQEIDNITVSGVEDISRLEELKYELNEILSEPVSDRVEELESKSSLGLMKIDSVLNKYRSISSSLSSSNQSALYSGTALADLMDDLRLSIASMNISNNIVSNVSAISPEVIERTKLNERFIDISSKITEALRNINEIADNYSITASGNAWFQSCFNGIDTLISYLYKPTTSNEELKKGIQQLEDAYERYSLMAPEIQKEVIKISTLYKIYAQVAHSLNENIRSMKSFKTAKELEEELFYLKERVERAEQCAQIYKQLGQHAYLCYAWDQELKAMGYQIHTRKNIIDKLQAQPEYATLGNNKFPFYEWGEKDLAQLYSMASTCDLHVVIHEDGSVSMKTLADNTDNEIVSLQKQHCDRLQELHRRLQKNWFIFYGYQENEGHEKITTIEQWKESDDFVWDTKTEPDIIFDERERVSVQHKQEKSL